MKSHITPNDIHFVRNHGGIPTVTDLDNYSVKIGGLVKNPGQLLFTDLKDPNKFPQVEMTITLQCSGTRRIEQINLYPGEGDGKSRLVVEWQDVELTYELVEKSCSARKMRATRKIDDPRKADSIVNLCFRRPWAEGAISTARYKVSGLVALTKT